MIEFHVTSGFGGKIGVKRILKIGSTGTVFHSREIDTAVKLRILLLNYPPFLSKQFAGAGSQC